MILMLERGGILIFLTLGDAHKGIFTLDPFRDPHGTKWCFYLYKAWGGWLWAAVFCPFFTWVWVNILNSVTHALMEWNICSGDEKPLSGCSCLNWYTPNFLMQGYSGTRHPHHQNLRWPASQRRTTLGSTPWTPSWSRSSWWALWGSCSEQCAPASSCTAPAPTAACRHAHPRPWRTTTSNCTTASSTRWNWTNSAAARRREQDPLHVILWKKKTS